MLLWWPKGALGCCTPCRHRRLLWWRLFAICCPAPNGRRERLSGITGVDLRNAESARQSDDSDWLIRRTNAIYIGRRVWECPRWRRLVVRGSLPGKSSTGRRPRRWPQTSNCCNWCCHRRKSADPVEGSRNEKMKIRRKPLQDIRMGESKDDVVERRWRFDDRPPISRCFIFDDAGVFLAVIPILIVDARRSATAASSAYKNEELLLIILCPSCLLSGHSTLRPSKVNAVDLFSGGQLQAITMDLLYSTLLHSTFFSKDHGYSDTRHFMGTDEWAFVGMSRKTFVVVFTEFLFFSFTFPLNPLLNHSLLAGMQIFKCFSHTGWIV